MRRETSVRPGRWVDCVEEETKMRKNLSRLIHTVQHMPSAKYHRDASSLWNLVGELESFQPSTGSRSPNCAQKTERKSFSRKYLDHRLYPSRDRSSSPECNLRGQKQDMKNQTLSSCKTKRNIKPEMKKKDSETDQNVEANAHTCQDKRPFRKTKYDRNKNCKENVQPETGKDKRKSFKEIQAKSELKGPHFNPRTKLQRFQLRRKSEEINLPKPHNSPEQLNKDKVKCCSNQEANDKSVKNSILDKLKGLKNFEYIKDKYITANQFDEGLHKTFSECSTLENDQASMVKKLTSYWNNLLNNVDDNEVSSSQEGSDVPVINKSLHDLTRSIYQAARDRQRKLCLPEHRSESSLNILKEFESFNDRSEVLKIQKENKDKFLECLSVILSNGDVSNIKPNKCLNSKEESIGNEIVVPTNPYFLEMGYDIGCGDSKNAQVMQTNMVEEFVKPNFDLRAQHAICVMEKLIRKLKRFANLPLTSDEITLSHSLRTMLCLMTATVLSSVDDHLELDHVVEVKVDEETDNNDNLLVASGYEVPSTERWTHIKTRNTSVRNDPLQLVAVQGITIRKVEDALRYLTLCKDYLWSEFLLSPRAQEDSNHRQSPRSFTFVFEEEICFEGDFGEDECPSEDDSDNEDVDNMMGEVCLSLFDSVLMTVERLSESVADMILHYRPHSFEGFVRTMYQTMVSLLVWWVITKEIFSK